LKRVEKTSSYYIHDNTLACIGIGEIKGGFWEFARTQKGESESADV